MAHNLNFKNGRASMFYVGETPWHQLGTKLDNPATAEEAIKAAQLDFEVKKLPNIHRFPDGREVVSPTSFFTYRTDDGAVLGSRLGAGYTVLQNRDAFKFFDEVVGAGEAIYHTAGVLGRGERIWLLAKLPDYVRVRVNGKDDPVEKYLLLANGHDGTLAVKGKLTPIRVVCENTLSAALGTSFNGNEEEGEETVTVYHTISVAENVKAAAKMLGIYNKLYENLEIAFNSMALAKITSEDLLAYVRRLVPAERGDDPEDESKYALAVQDKLIELHDTGVGSELARGTAWGAYNAATEYADHIARSDGHEATMLKSMWFGGAREQLKIRAFDLALKMATDNN